MIIETRLTEKEFVSAGWLALRKRSLLAKFSLAVFPLFALFLFSVAAIVVSSGQTWEEQWSLLLMGVLLAVFPLLWFPFVFRRSYRKVPLLAEPRIFEFDETGMHLSGSAYNSRTTWDLFSKFAENEQVFIIYQQGDVIYFPLPKRDLSQPTQDAIREILLAHLRLA